MNFAARVLSVAFEAGVASAVIRASLAAFYPLVAGLLWQRLLGPLVARHFPACAQSEDWHRPSFVPREGDRATYTHSFSPALWEPFALGFAFWFAMACLAAYHFAAAVLSLVINLVWDALKFRPWRAASCAQQVDEAFKFGAVLLEYIASFWILFWVGSALELA